MVRTSDSIGPFLLQPSTDYQRYSSVQVALSILFFNSELSNTLTKLVTFARINFDSLQSRTLAQQSVLRRGSCSKPSQQSNSMCRSVYERRQYGCSFGIHPTPGFRTIRKTMRAENRTPPQHICLLRLRPLRTTCTSLIRRVGY